MRRKPGSLLGSLWRLPLALEELDCGRNEGKWMLQRRGRVSELAVEVCPEGEPRALTAAFGHFFPLLGVTGCCAGGDDIFSLSLSLSPNYVTWN